MRILKHPILEKQLFETINSSTGKASAMNKTSLFAVLFTAAMLCSILSMLAKLCTAVESAAAAFPSAL